MTNPLAPGSLAGRVALVTGSSRGIGADTVRYLAAAGASVVVNYRSKAPRAEKVVAEIEAAGGTAIAVGADLTDAASVAAMFERAATRTRSDRHPGAECLRRHGDRAWARTTRCG